MWYKLSSKIKAHDDIEEVESGTNDISGNWQPFLDIWFELVCKMKVPHKSKKYDQMFFRTMFFPRVESVTIDGVKHEIPNHIRVDTWNSKSLIVAEVFPVFQEVEDMEKENFLETKKKLVTKLKEFDKQYVKHVKKTHPEVQEIITKAITPLLDLLESNYNFHKLEELKKTRDDIPRFRYTALEDKFCEHFEVVCKILENHGKLEDLYDIKRMLNLLKLDNWQENVPMSFYLNPLKKAIKEAREELLRMRELGPNRCKYYVEDNEPMHQLTIKMVKSDGTAQWLMGDSLKNDQLCFLYDVIKIIFKSNLKNKLINKDKELIDNVIPKLGCFKALLVIKNILEIQFEEKKQAKKGAILPNPDEPEEIKEGEGEQEEVQELPDDEDIDMKQQRIMREQKEAEDKEMRMYGRKWIWQNYISDNRKNDWMNTSQSLTKINEHVISDIVDYILISGFAKARQNDRKAIKDEVDGLLTKSNIIANKDSKEEIENAKNKREFELMHRPPYVWNFFETRIDHEEKIKIESQIDKKDEDKQIDGDTEDDDPHLINYKADPELCYKNEESIHENRVSQFMKDLDSLTYNLKSHEQAKWNMLTELCINIFKE